MTKKKTNQENTPNEKAQEKPEEANDQTIADVPKIETIAEVPKIETIAFANIRLNAFKLAMLDRTARRYEGGLEGATNAYAKVLEPSKTKLELDVTVLTMKAAIQEGKAGIKSVIQASDKYKKLILGHTGEYFNINKH